MLLLLTNDRVTLLKNLLSSASKGTVTCKLTGVPQIERDTLRPMSSPTLPLPLMVTNAHVYLHLIVSVMTSL